VGIDPANNGPCNQANDGQTSFAEAVIWDPTNNQLLAYHPLIIDQGTAALVTPTVPALPQGSTTAIWFGSNANTITLMDNANGNNIAAGNCVNGITQVGVGLSVFGQFAYCNAITFFALTMQAAIAKSINGMPPLGIAIDGLPCPTTRAFDLVDMDPSDNVITTYLVNAAGLVAQNNTVNLMNLGIANVMFKVNPSDEKLLTAIDAAIGCTPWRIRNLDDPQNLGGVSTLASNELHALAYQTAPIALIPLGDPMVRVNNQPSLAKVNQYRQGLGQPTAATNADASIVDFCTNFYNLHPRRLLKNFKTLINFASPAPTVADSLFTFMAQRFFQAFGRNNLNCQDLLQVVNPVNLTVNGNGLVVGAIIVPPASGNTAVAPVPVVTPTAKVGAASSMTYNGVFLAASLALAYMARF